MLRQRTIPLLVLLCLLLPPGCGGGGGGSSGGSSSPGSESAPAQPPPETSNAAADLAVALNGKQFQEILSVAVPAMALRDPQQVLADGLARDYGLEEVALTDISFSYRRESFDMWQEVRKALDELDAAALSAADQLSYDIYSWLVDSMLAQRRFIHYDFQASYFLTSVPSQLQRFFVDLHPLATAQDARDYLGRLALVDETIAVLIDNLQEMEAEGVIESAITLRVAIDVHRQVATGSAADSPYYQGLAQRLGDTDGLEEGEAADIRGRARSLISSEIIPAYRQLVDFLGAQLPRAPADVGVGQYPRGEAYYRERLRFHTTTSLTAEEIHQLGLRELERIHAEQRQLFDQLAYPRDESLERLYQRVAEEGGQVLAADAIGTYEALIDNAEINMAPLFQRLPDTEVVVIGGDNGGFYISASLDGSRPGAFYAGTSYDQPYYLMPTLAYHEAMPGHHMQIALAQEAAIPEFRRNLTFTGFVEGWGLYAEHLAGESGWYANDIYGDLGRLYYEGVRAARLVVDTGIHSRGWGFDRATAFYRENVGSSLRSAQSNIARYSLYTGQATAYMVGMLSILELRERLRVAQAGGFDIAAFHALVLDEGALPLDLLAERVEREVALSGQ